MYVHHDIVNPAFPLCTTRLHCPRKAGEKGPRGNFIAVGSMEPAIEIWDLDIMDEVQPSAVLGGIIEKRKKRKKHGAYECLLNTVEACAIDVWPDVKDHFPFIYCVESLVYQHNYTYWEICFEKLGLDASPVNDCYKGKRGTELELYAAKINVLQPPHRYVPWVVVDGQPLYDDYQNFQFYICKAYKGTGKPTACTELSVGFIRKVKMNLFDSLYGDKSSQSKLFGAVEAVLSWLQRNKMVASL